VESHTAGFYDSNGDFQTVELRSGNPMQVWVDYDSKSYSLNVTLAPHPLPKPKLPLLSTTLNLSSVLSYSSLYAGFSAATSKLLSNHYVLSWSFKLHGEAPPLEYSQLPFGDVEDLKHHAHDEETNHMNILGAPSIVPAVTLIVLALLICRHLRNRREDEELDTMCGLPSFTYKELVCATDGFNDSMVLGKGGFGKVYRGVLRNSAQGQSVAIKPVSQESRQGKREFMAEIAILGRVRHRNLVQLLGYCRHKEELLLVYIAPELARLGKATKATDIFAFGVFIMEVVCGRRPISTAMDGGEPLTLADWVHLAKWLTNRCCRPQIG